MPEPTTRERIVAEADRLFYEHGYELTSFTAIADSVGISRGNFYYHFKSKDEILDAVIEARLTNTQRLLLDWEEEGAGPAACIRSFIRILVANQAKIMRHGCPVGTLCMELAKSAHGSRDEANKIMTLFRAWLRRQFSLLGHEADADALAMHVLVFSQGVAVLAATYQDERFIQQQVEHMCAWLDAIAAQAAGDRD